ncbi:hypothetical protein K504DRAFT_282073 [Pleomassaria siparia CBS 279.74]|uniref:Uncharacterized protein n=1 Tax=Pleomassaria siparia CBS 279.74 TaxID=1314801 RepID=A0A6G1KAC0_9PLEO|nr:hypothetical protein K504DRAFT_282073 [Pleomassaria siparia CBS 279.74]
MYTTTPGGPLAPLASATRADPTRATTCARGPATVPAQRPHDQTSAGAWRAFVLVHVPTATESGVGAAPPCSSIGVSSSGPIPASWQ